MSSRRQGKNEAFPEEDVEAPHYRGDAGAAASASDSIPAPGRGRPAHNPIFLAKAILRKVVGLACSDEEDVTSPGGMVTLLKDIAIGVFIGFLYMTAIIFLDHRDIIHYQTAHDLRDAGFRLLADPETMANIEEASGLKFLLMSDYESKMKLIESSAERIRTHEEDLKGKEGEAEEKRKELESVREEYNKLLENPLVEIDKFCGECSWAGKTSCGARVQFMQDTYNMGLIASKISAMEVPTCKKS